LQNRLIVLVELFAGVNVEISRRQLLAPCC
jgi:hypothetical protein